MRYEDEPIALTGGAWVLDPRTRVQVWQVNPGYTFEPACDKCGAMPWEQCVTRTSKRANYHRGRRGTQTCMCGGPLVAGGVYCADCLGWGERDVA